jgi:hypothetical protein
LLSSTITLHTQSITVKMKFSVAAFAAVAIFATSAHASVEEEAPKRTLRMTAKDRLLQKIHEEKDRRMKEGIDGEADHKPERELVDLDGFVEFLGEESNSVPAEGRRDQETAPENYGNYGGYG